MWSRAFAHKNGASCREYTGSNALYLSFIARKRGYNDPRWFTFKEAVDRGYKIRKQNHVSLKN